MKRNESGMILLEAVFCMIIVVIVMLMILGLGFAVYQHAVVEIVANETAEEVSKTYKLRNSPSSSDVNDFDVTTPSMYRYVFSEKKYTSKAISRAKQFAEERIGLTNLAEKKNDMNISVEVIRDSVGRRHYQITVSQKYGFLAGKLLQSIGLWEEKTISCTAYSAGVDVSHHVNAINNYKYIVNEFKEHSKFVDTVDTVYSLLHTVFEKDDDKQLDEINSGNKSESEDPSSGRF